MSLIDYTYFQRDINVPINNVSDSDPGYLSIKNSIERYENEVLKSLLGYTMWKEFTDAVTASYSGTALASKWTNLRDGAEFSFTYNGQTVSDKWMGLANSDKVSLISYYVYFKHRMDGQTSYTGIGETEAAAENARVVGGAYKMIMAWNKMIELYGEIPYPTVKYKSVFNDLDNYIHYNDGPSAYNFLLANKATYTTWKFNPLRKKHNYF